MNAAQWHQEIVVKPVEKIIPSPDHHIISSSKPNNNNLGASGGGGGGEKKASGSVVRPPKEQPVPCPRCNSINTKFCYYNNYSLTQPRYFCKGCRRYWTEGGSLRNIPVGGGSRKHKRSPSAAAAAQQGVDAKKLFVHPSFQNPNTMIQHHQQPDQRTGHDLNLSFPNHHQDYRSMSDFVHHHMPNTSSSQTAAAATTSSHLSALELLTGMTSRGSVGGVGVGVGGGYSNSFMPITDPDSVYSSASFSNFMHDFKPPTLNFSLDNGLGIGSSGPGGFGTSPHNDDQVSTNGGGGGRVLGSTFDGMKSPQVDQDHHQHQQHQQQSDQNRGHGVSTGYWSGMLGSGGGSDW